MLRGLHKVIAYCTFSIRSVTPGEIKQHSAFALGRRRNKFQPIKLKSLSSDRHSDSTTPEGQDN